jgi:hypothetical protein
MDAIIDADNNNLVLIGLHNPREALSRIHMLVREAKHDIRNGDTGTAFEKMNKIDLLSGGPL